MPDHPLPVVLGLVTNDRAEVLLVRRTGGDFSGRWGFPGGKVERDEFIADAIEREVLEETGISAVFQDHRGVVSEHVMDGDTLVKHVPLHICSLTPDTDSQQCSDAATWVARDRLGAIRDETVPSLVPIVNAFLNTPERRYYESVIDIGGDAPTLDRFA